MLIDAHQHLWRTGAPWHAWPTSASPEIHRDYEVADLRSVRDSAGVGGSILVQSQPAEADTLWLLEQADRDDTLLGVVGWTNLKASDASDRIHDLSTHRRLVGIRPMLQDHAPGWLADDALEPAVEAMVGARLGFDALVTPSHLGDLLAFARRWPDLPIIIDHCAKPALSGEGFEVWRDGIAALASRPHVWCKLSGLLTEGADENRGGAVPIVQTVLNLFGPERIVWGSDWPVLTLRTDYGDWLQMCCRLVDRMAPGHEAAIFGGNATRFYEIGPKDEADEAS